VWFGITGRSQRLWLLRQSKWGKVSSTVVAVLTHGPPVYNLTDRNKTNKKQLTVTKRHYEKVNSNNRLCLGDGWRC
jgi:hypothetical protein